MRSTAEFDGMPRLPAGSLLSMRETWRAAGALASKPQAIFIRGRLVTGAISALSMILLPTTLVAAALLHNWGAGAAFLFMLAAQMANLALSQVSVIWLAFQQGFWIGWKRTPAHRMEQPGQFYGWTSAHTLLAAIHAIASIFLAYFAIQMLISHPH